MKHTILAAVAPVLLASTVHAAEPAPAIDDGALRAQHTQNVVVHSVLGGGAGLVVGALGGGFVALGLGAWNGAFHQDSRNYLQVGTPAEVGGAIFAVGAVVGGVVGAPIGVVSGALIAQE